MEFPLAERELARSGKRRATYALRVVPVALAAIGLFFALPSVYMSLEQSVAEEAAYLVSALLLGVSRLFQVAVVFLVAPLLTAGLVAREKQERTLPLLMLADFRGWDLFFAKFISAFLQVELLVLSMLPLMAFGSFLGGISVPGAVAQLVLFSLAGLAVCAIGVFMSTVSQGPPEALWRTFLAVLGWLAATMGLDRYCLVGTGTANILAAAWSPAMAQWWPAALIACGLAAIFSMLAVWLLPRQACERVPRPVSRRRARGLRGAPKAGPIAQLIAAGSGDQGHSASFLARVASVVGLTLLSASCIGITAVHAAAFYAIASSLAVIRRSSVIDDLTLTGVNPSTLARAILRAQLRKWPQFFLALLVGNAWLYGIIPFTFLGGTLGINVSVQSAPVLAGVLAAVFAITLVQWRFIVAMTCQGTASELGPVGQTVTTSILYWAGHFFVLYPAGVIGGQLIGKLAPTGHPAGITVLVLAAAGLILLCHWALGRFFEKEFVRYLSETRRSAAPSTSHPLLP